MSIKVKISKALANDYARRAALGERPGYGDKENGYAGHFPTSEGEWDLTFDEAGAMLKDALVIGGADETRPSMAMAYTSLATRIKKQLGTLDEKVREVIEKQDGVSQRNLNSPGSEFVQIDASDIQVEKQVRTEFNEESIRELADDIQVNGQIQPVTVRPSSTVPGKWLLVAGERRVRACQIAGVDVLARIINADDVRTRRIQIAENIQREDLSLNDKADAVNEIYQELGNMQAVANLVKKSKGWVSKLVAFRKGLGYWSRMVLEEGISEDLEVLMLLDKIDAESQGTNRCWSLVEKMKKGEAGRKELQEVLKGLKKGPDSKDVHKEVIQNDDDLVIKPKDVVPEVVGMKSAQVNSEEIHWTEKPNDPFASSSQAIQAEEADEFEELLCRAWKRYENHLDSLEAWIDAAMEIGALADVFPREVEDKLFFLKGIVDQFFIDEMKK
jgi:ParB family chromosome partitioning protein